MKQHQMIDIEGRSRQMEREKIVHPSREEISKAVEEFLKNGGKINKLKPQPRQSDQYLSGPSATEEVDEFLLGD